MNVSKHDLGLENPAISGNRGESCNSFHLPDSLIYLIDQIQSDSKTTVSWLQSAKPSLGYATIEESLITD